MTYMIILREKITYVIYYIICDKLHIKHESRPLSLHPIGTLYLQCDYHVKSA